MLWWEKTLYYEGFYGVPVEVKNGIPYIYGEIALIKNTTTIVTKLGSIPYVGKNKMKKIIHLYHKLRDTNTINKILYDFHPENIKMNNTKIEYNGAEIIDWKELSNIELGRALERLRHGISTNASYGIIYKYTKTYNGKLKILTDKKGNKHTEIMGKKLLYKEPPQNITTKTLGTNTIFYARGKPVFIAGYGIRAELNNGKTPLEKLLENIKYGWIFDGVTYKKKYYGYTIEQIKGKDELTIRNALGEKICTTTHIESCYPIDIMTKKHPSF